MKCRERKYYLREWSGDNQDKKNSKLLHKWQNTKSMMKFQLYLITILKGIFEKKTLNTHNENFIHTNLWMFQICLFGLASLHQPFCFSKFFFSKVSKMDEISKIKAFFFGYWNSLLCALSKSENPRTFLTYFKNAKARS